MPSARMRSRVVSSRSTSRKAWTAGLCRRASTKSKVIVLRRDRQETKPVKARDRLNGDPPIGAMLCDGGRYGIVRARLIGIADWLGTAEKAVDEHTRAGTGIAVDHQNSGIGQCRLQRGLGAKALKARIARTKHKALHAPPARDQRQPRFEQMLVVDTSRGIDEVNRRDVAFAAACGIDAAKAGGRDGG